MRTFILLARARGLTWSVPGIIAVIAAGAWCAHALESQPAFDHHARVPAVVLAGLSGSYFAISCLHTGDAELDGATPRPSRAAVLGLVLALVCLGALCAVLWMPLAPYERGGAELARNLIGLTGLGLLGAAFGGNAVGWSVPFVWSAISYLGVTRDYQGHPGQAVWGWLMFPASRSVTWVLAGGLLAAGVAAYAWAGFQPRPRQHPLR